LGDEIGEIGSSGRENRTSISQTLPVLFFSRIGA
jgi:hypothetical protein